MQPRELWASDAKFVEYGLRDAAVGTALRAHGFENYLGVARTERIRDAVARAEPAICDRLAVTDVQSAVRKNNADVLVLSGFAAWNLVRFRQLRHAEFVAWCPGLSLAAPLALVGWLVNRLLRRLSAGRLIVLKGGSRRPCRLIVFRVLRRKGALQTRRYIPHRVGVQGFLAWMMRERTPHAVLRWFETLPTLEPGEDLDLLVDDAVLDQVGGFLNAGPGIVPCDLYSVTGLPGSDFRSMPYFPPYLANSLLKDAVVHRDLCRVPSPQHHFLSMAFHALYHKGTPSGLPHRDGEGVEAADPEHDYTTVLRELADQLDVKAEISMEQLDEHLRAEGWRPPHDYLVRLAKRNEWIRTIVEQDRTDPEDPGLAVFIVRREAIVRGRLDFIIGKLQYHGFSLVETKILTEEESATMGNRVRGGNWGRGPWKMSGGLPAAAVVVYDTTPVTPKKRQKRKFPLVTNARLLCKKMIRDAFNDLDPPEKHCNIIHSSDNGHEALEYIQIAMPGRIEQIHRKIAEIKAAFETSEPVLATLTRGGRRAKIELIKLHGESAVKKTFKTSQDRFLQREVTAMTDLNKLVPEIPRLLEAEGNAVVMPYYTNSMPYKRSSGKLLPLSSAKAAIRGLRRVYDSGYALIDASVDNILVDRREGLKLIDFEFLYRYEQKPDSFEQSYDVAGCPDDFVGDRPYGGPKSYERSWRPYVGLSLQSLEHDPTWLQHGKRCGYYMAHLPRFLPRRIRYYFRNTFAAIKTVWGVLAPGSLRSKKDASAPTIDSHREHVVETHAASQSRGQTSTRDRKAA